MLKHLIKEPSTDLLQLSREEIAKQLEDKIHVRNAGIASLQAVSPMSVKNVGIKTPSPSLQPSDGHAVKKKTGDETQAHSLEQVAKQLEHNIQVGNGGELATSQSAGQMNVLHVGIKALRPSYAQAVSKKGKTVDTTQPLSPEEVANVQLDDNSQVGNAGFVPSQSAGQMNVANIRVATKLRSVKNVEIATSPSEKPDITESAKDPPTSSIRSLKIGTSQYEDEINAEKQGELATSESKGALLEKNQEMKKSRKMKRKKLENGGGQVSSSLTEEFEKQLEGHNANVGNAENAEKPGIIESEVENSPTSSSKRNLEVGTSLLSKNIYSAIAPSDEINAENQGAATSESKVELAQLEIKQKRRKPKKQNKMKKK